MVTQKLQPRLFL